MRSLLPAKRVRRDYTGDPDEFRLTLVEHLEELRDRIIRSLLIITFFWIVGWYILPPIYSYLNDVSTKAIKPVLPPGADYREVVHSFTDAFMLKFKLSFVIGVGLSFPFLILQLWAFIQPALKPNEAKPLQRLAPVSVVLFLTGAGFAWLILPGAMRWLATYVGEFPGISLYQDAGTFVFFVLKILIAFGFSFELPLIVYILGALDLLSAETLLKYWRQSATAIFVIAMIVTPSQDPATMLAMAIPLCLLFMGSVYVVKFTQGKRKKARIIQEDSIE